MKKWEKRLHKEYDKLITKTSKLAKFLSDGHHDEAEIDPVDLGLLEIQYDAMSTYLTILEVRIGLLESEESEEDTDENG